MNHGEDTATDGGELIPAEPGPEEERSIRSQDDFQELVELERRRIDRDNRRTQLAEKALELANDQDKRGFEYASKQQQMADRSEERRFRLAWSLSIGVLVVMVAVTGLTMWMAFFGDDVQRAVAQELGRNGLVGLAGFGVVSGLIRLVRSLLRT